MEVHLLIAHVQQEAHPYNKTVVYLKRTAITLGIVIVIAAFIIGIVFKDQCPADSLIPTWLIVSSSIYIFSMVLAMLGFENTAKIFGYIGGAFHSLVCISVLLAGVIIKLSSDDQDDTHYCNQILYVFSCAYSILFCGLVVGAMMYWLR